MRSSRPKWTDCRRWRVCMYFFLIFFNFFWVYVYLRDFKIIFLIFEFMSLRPKWTDCCRWRVCMYVWIYEYIHTYAYVYMCMYTHVYVCFTDMFFFLLLRTFFFPFFLWYFFFFVYMYALLICVYWYVFFSLFPLWQRQLMSRSWLTLLPPRCVFLRLFNFFLFFFVFTHVGAHHLVYVCVWAYRYICTYMSCNVICAYIYIRTYIYMYIHAYIYIHMYVYIHICAYVCIYTYMCPTVWYVYIHICTHPQCNTYTYEHTHHNVTHTHIYTQGFAPEPDRSRGVGGPARNASSAAMSSPRTVPKSGTFFFWIFFEITYVLHVQM